MITGIPNPIVYANLTGNQSAALTLDASFGPLYTALNTLLTYSNGFVDTGAVNALSIAVPSPLVYSATRFLRVQVLVANSNNGPATLQVNGGGLVAIVAAGGGALVGGELAAGRVAELMFDGASWQILSGSAITPGIRPGTIIDFVGASAPPGTLICDGSSQLISVYPNLSAQIRSILGGADGTHFWLPDLRGRIRLGSGTGINTETFADTAVNLGTDTITLASNLDKWISGMPIVTVFNTGTITTSPASQITNGGNAWVVRTGLTTIKLSNSLANAQNGVVIDMTAVTGGGSFTLNQALKARSVGANGGAEDDSMTISTLLAHVHTYNAQLNYNGVNADYQVSNQKSNLPANTGSTGGNTAMNNTQPYFVCLPCIYY